jgi:UrcA family protein
MRRVVAAIIATVAGVHASFAETPAKDRETTSITVGYADLNLAKPEGSRVLYQRVVDAAQKLCPTTGYVTELRQNRDAQRCVTDTVERTLKQIKSPQFAQGAARQRR